MSEDYEFKRISADQFSQFGELCEDAFGVEFSQEQIENLFNTKAFGAEFIGYMAYESKTGEPAAFYGVFPCRVEIGGVEYLAAQSGSTMTHTRHRRKGLFYKTANRTFELAKEEGIKFIFGFPNSNSYPAFMKMGWTHDGEMNGYHLITPTFPLGFLANKISIIRPLFEKWFDIVTRFWSSKEYGPIPNSSLSKEGAGGIVRSADLLKYKSGDHSRKLLRLGESGVWIRESFGRFSIGDINLGENDDLRSVLRKLRLISFLTGCFHLVTYLSPGSALDLQFAQEGFVPRKALPICYFDLGSGLPLEQVAYVYGDFDTF